MTQVLSNQSSTFQPHCNYLPEVSYPLSHCVTRIQFLTWAVSLTVTNEWLSLTPSEHLLKMVCRAQAVEEMGRTLQKCVSGPRKGLFFGREQIPVCSCRSLNQYFLISSTIVNMSRCHPCHCGNRSALVTAQCLNLVFVCLSFSASSVPLCNIALPGILSDFTFLLLTYLLNFIFQIYFFVCFVFVF